MTLTACATLVKYAPATCAVVPGGIAQIFIFDSTIFDFTQAAPTGGVIAPYTAITDLGSSDKLYPVKFQRMKAKYTYKQSNTDGVSPSYEHSLHFSVPNLNQLNAQWSTLVDATGYCCGVGVIMILNSGVILVMGEGSVNTNPLTVPFYVYQDGSAGDTGEKMQDTNSAQIVLKGEYNRPLIQYTGAASTITALSA